MAWPPNHASVVTTRYRSQYQLLNSFLHVISFLIFTSIMMVVPSLCHLKENRSHKIKCSTLPETYVTMFHADLAGRPSHFYVEGTNCAYLWNDLDLDHDY